jgi:signal transduction histidine kinase
MRVDFTMAAETDAVDADGGRHAFRLVQEALTNARKHAPGMPVVLDIHADDGVTIDVRNRLATVNGSTIDELAAMTERATLGGGTVEHTVVDGELRVTAHLPKREP